MTKKNEYIKCCPFCGSVKVDVCRTNENACWISCAKCQASTDSHKTQKGAIKKWNMRNTPEAVIVYDDEVEDNADEIRRRTKGE
jgi:Lar family restriction alleviation protein